MSCFVPVDAPSRIRQITGRGRQFGDTKRALHLVNCSRHHKPNEERKQSSKRDIVKRYTNPPRNFPTSERVDTRTHGRGDHDSQEDQRDDEPELP